MKSSAPRTCCGPNTILKIIFLVGPLITAFNFCYNYDFNWLLEPPKPQIAESLFLIPSHSPDDNTLTDNKVDATEASPEEAEILGTAATLVETTSTVIVKQKCEIPKLIPGDALVYKLDYQQAAPYGRLYDPACVNNSAAKFFTDVDGKLILNIDPENDKFWNTSACFYQPFWRVRNKPDFSVQYGKEVPISTNDEADTILPRGFDYFRVFCLRKGTETQQRRELVYEDVVFTTQPNAEIEAALADRPANQRDEFYSFLIFGMDSSSHMNFRRYMPSVHDYLVNEMDAVEFNGFNSLGPGTLWSVFALLSGMDLDEVRSSCWKKPGDFIDGCPWIWKELESLGYRTGYAEDEMFGTPIFNEFPKPGFSRQPWHYDFRPAALKFQNVRVGHNLHGAGSSGSVCWGSRLAFDQLVENMAFFAHTFMNKPYWHFTWSVGLSHYKNLHSKYGERMLYQALETLNGMQRLNNTVVIILSDHGMRYGPLRQQTRQGFLEERLPILYISLPSKFRAKYPEAYRNFRENSNKLTSAFDIYATMKDLLDPTEHVTDMRIAQRSAEPSLESKREVSLFLPISASRDCNTIGLTKHFTYCACRNRQSSPVNSTDVRAAAQATVEYINGQISNFTQCSRLKLKQITEAYNLDVEFSLSDERARFKDNEHRSKDVLGAELEIGIETTPGGGRFYAGVVKQRVGWSFVVGDISRMSAYGHDGDCMDLKELKPFCYCGDS